MQPKLTLNLHYVLMCEREQYAERMGWVGWMRKDGAKIWFEVTHGQLFEKAQRKMKVRIGWMRTDCIGAIQC